MLSLFLFSIQIFLLQIFKYINMSVHLLSSDNEEFKVDKDVAERSVLIKNMLEGKYTLKKKKKNAFAVKKKEALYIYQCCPFRRYWRL